MEKVLILTSTYPKSLSPGTHFLHELSRHYQKKELDVIVITPRTEGTKVYEEKDNLQIYRFAPNLIPSISLTGRSGIPASIRKNPLSVINIPYFFLSQLFTLYKISRRYKIKAIHAQWLLPSGLVAVFFKLFFDRNVRVICTSRGSDVNFLNTWYINGLRHIVLRHIDDLVCVSPQLKDKLEQLGYKRMIHVQPTGVDVSIFTPNPTDVVLEKNILFVGAVDLHKGVQFLLPAFAVVLERVPDASLIIVGSGSLLDDIKRQVASLGISDHVVIAGQVANNELPNYYRKSRVFVLPSMAEGFPVSISEALATGLMCVTSNIPVFQELENKYPFINTVDPRDTIKFGRILSEILVDNRKLGAIGEEAREYAIKYLDRDKTNAFYTELVFRQLQAYPKV